ncbi:LysR family transcriptional regulator [Rarobacter faecitabidus]|uniref:Molybdate transport repressor ModE-like protein n=1 Tax=Rarobacter faecitabidus TaxID=13243 RepID=A0A542ZXG0_RARFA|nr:molybdate transport repressor ModE-like protein [Rarobacter faecitabidus]
MSLASLQIITAIDEYGSISAAARALGLSQPAASAAARRLERRVGARLLDRGARGTSLSETGRAVAAWARGVIDASDAFETAVAALGQTHDERVRVAASMTVAEYLAPQWLARLSAKHSGYDVELIVRNSRAVMELVRDGEVELGFVEGTDVDYGLRSRVVARDELVAVVAPGHRWARRQAVSLDQLLDAELVVREVGSGTRQVLERTLRDAGLALPDHLPHLGSTAAIKSAVRHGGSLAVLSRLTVSEEIEHGILVPVEVLGADLARELVMVWRDDTVLGAAGLELAALAVRGN